MHASRVHVRKLCSLVALSLAVAGCSSAGDPAREAPDSAHAHAVSENLLGGVAQGDYAEFSRDFTPELAALFDEEAFVDLLERLNHASGEFVSVAPPELTASTASERRFETDAVFEKEDVHVWIWFSDDDPRLCGLWLDSPGLQSAP